MGYLVKRGETNFGPYTLTDLQQYVQSGNIALEDLAQSEGVSDWISVRKILGDIPLATPAATVVQPVQAELVALPPNLHWAILLVINLLTRYLFNWIWAFVLANWGRKLSGRNTAMVLVSMYPAGFIAGVLAVMLHFPLVGGLLFLGGAVVYLFGVFAIREAMEDYYNSRENIGLKLSGAMTFFFSTIYLQYHVNGIARWKKTGVLT
jgi:hypothetical protein